MAVFTHGIDIKIVVSENAKWLVTLENTLIHLYI